VQLAVKIMEVVEAVNGCRLEAGSVAGRCWDGDKGQQNGDVFQSETDASSGCPSSTSAVFENHSSLPNDRNNDDDWTNRRPESVWLEYLYSWNPLAAGILTTSAVMGKS